MRRLILVGWLLMPLGSAVAQDGGPMVLTPPGLDSLPPAVAEPPAALQPIAPLPQPTIDLAPIEQAVMNPPMPRLRPRGGAGTVAATPADMATPAPFQGDQPQLRVGDTGIPTLGAEPAPPQAAIEPQPAPDGGILPEALSPEAAAAVASLGQPPPAEPGKDMAYGAFQRGYYLSAFSLAIPQAEAGDTAAQTLLGLIYEGGYGVPRDEQQAASWYRFAAEGGNREAQYALGMMYREGRGVPQDQAMATSLFEAAAQSGQVAATYNLALVYLEGKQRPIEVGRAAQLLTEAAEGGNPDAQYVLAQLYEDGRGVPQDESLATQWFAEAARLGNIPAQVEYAIRLFNGVGTPPDEAGAARWFQRAAEVGNPIAQNRLARLLATGRGISADPLAAAKWHVLAKGAGRSDEFLDRFFAELTDQQRQTAVALAQRWPAD